MYPYQKYIDKLSDNPNTKFIFIPRCPGKVNKGKVSERKKSI
jgi:hypothetical protein